MSVFHKFFLCAASPQAGLTSVSLGVARAFDRLGVRVAFCKPITQREDRDQAVDPSIGFAERLFAVKPPTPISIRTAERFLRENKVDELMERVVEMVEGLSSVADVVVVEGLLPEEAQSFKNRLNRAMAKALGAEILFVGRFEREDYAGFDQQMEVAATTYGAIQDHLLAGCIANRVQFANEDQVPILEGTLPVLVDDDESAQILATPGLLEAAREEAKRIREKCAVLKTDSFSLVGCIPENVGLRSIRMVDVAKALRGEVLFEGAVATRRVSSMALCARNVPNMLHTLRPGALIIAPGDRHDVILAVALAAWNKVPLAGLVLTGVMPLDERTLALCRNAFAGSDLPVLRVASDSFKTASILSTLSAEVPGDDFERIERVVDFVARHLDHDWMKERVANSVATRLSPAAFRYMLSRTARADLRRIVLPEGEETRTIVAAIACAERGIAHCVLLGNREEIRRVAEANGLALPSNLEIVDPVDVRERYLAPLLERRSHKGLSEERAREGLEDNVILGTMMLALDEVDGLVSGAIHSSANTIRPALQLIKTKPGARVVSSVFFMCLPDEVLVYGDCAVNPDPDAEALADIAVQSAETAEQFGIEPRVAMISYSTGESGSGADVEKVRKATQLARALRPDLLIDGPLQYDAASTPDVAEKKAPGSLVAGRATVFVFPDLNTGNTTYKAVQRSANLISIGPILQGLRKPVNDLSRGALVDDIIYTIAATAIQAQGNDGGGTQAGVVN